MRSLAKILLMVSCMAGFIHIGCNSEPIRTGVKTHTQEVISFVDAIPPGRPWVEPLKEDTACRHADQRREQVIRGLEKQNYFANSRQAIVIELILARKTRGYQKYQFRNPDDPFEYLMLLFVETDTLLNNGFDAAHWPDVALLDISMLAEQEELIEQSLNSRELGKLEPQWRDIFVHESAMISRYTAQTQQAMTFESINHQADFYHYMKKWPMDSGAEAFLRLVLNLAAGPQILPEVPDADQRASRIFMEFFYHAVVVDD